MRNTYASHAYAYAYQYKLTHTAYSFWSYYL